MRPSLLCGLILRRTALLQFSTLDSSTGPTSITPLVRDSKLLFFSEKSYLIRLVNGAIDTHWDFSIDNHTLTVIAADFVPIVPYNATSVSIGIGQRYDIVVTADQSNVASDFWIRAVPDAFCSRNANRNNIRGIVHYNSKSFT